MTISLRTRWLLALAFVALLHAWTLHRWIKADQRTLAWDQAIHTEIAYTYQDRFEAHGFTGLFKRVFSNYPPAFHLSLMPALGMVDDIADAGAVVNFFYLCVLMLAVYFIGEHLMSAWEGGTAAIVVGAYPVFIDLYRQTMIDFVLTAWVAVTFLCLIKSEDFSRPVWAAFGGAALGIGMLTKYTALAYVLAPFALFLWRGFRSKNYVGIACWLGVWALVAAPWYATNVIPLFQDIAHLSKLPPADGREMSRLAVMLWYPLALFDQLNLLFLLLLLPGLAVAFWRPKLTPVLLWFVVSLILFNCINNKNVRYSAPALPAAALLSVAWLPTVRRIPYVVVSLIAVAFLLIFNFYPITRSLGHWGPQNFWLMEGRPAYPGDWMHVPVIERIKSLKRADDNIAQVTVVSNHAHFHSTTLSVTARSKNVRDIAFHGVRKDRWFEFADFVLVKTGDIGPVLTGKNVRDCAAFVENPAPWFKKTFKEVDRWKLPDGSEAVLYQCSPDPQEVPDVGIFNMFMGHMKIKNVTAINAGLRAVPASAAQSRLGRLKELHLQSQAVEYRNLRFENIDIKLVRPQINVPLYFATQEIQLLALDSIEVSARVSSGTILGYAAKKAKWLKEPALSFDGGVINVSGKVGSVPIRIAEEVMLKGTMLKTKLLKISIAGIPLPRFFLRAMTDQSIDLNSNLDRAYALKLGGIHGEGAYLRIGP